MTNYEITTLLNETTDGSDREIDQPPTGLSTADGPESERSGRGHPGGARLDRSFASEYLDELIIAILFRCEEANGMDIIREFTHQFGVQFSPGTVYPHLHSLEEEGVLACQERVQTKEYQIDDEDAALAYVEAVVSQMSFVRDFLGPIADGTEQA